MNQENKTCFQSVLMQQRYNIATSSKRMLEIERKRKKDRNRKENGRQRK